MDRHQIRALRQLALRLRALEQDIKAARTLAQESSNEITDLETMFFHCKAAQAEVMKKLGAS